MKKEIKRIKPIIIYEGFGNNMVIAVPSLYSRRLVRKLTKTKEFRDSIKPWKITFDSKPSRCCLKRCWPEIDVPITNIEGNYFITKSSWVYSNRHFVKHEIIATEPIETYVDIINALWKALVKVRRGKWNNCGIIWCNRLYI